MYTEMTDEYAFARPYIAPGEAVLWRGKPGKGHLVTAQDAIMIPFSIFWCGGVFFWEYLAISEGAPLFFCLFGVPFLCVGLYMVFGRFFHTAWRRKRMAYVITTKRIIRARGERIDMLSSASLPPMHVTAFRDGSGTIRFGETVYYRGRRRSGYEYDSAMFELENIPDVARVQQLIDRMER